jgi:transcriptional regulator with XRE-family HTH domain
MTPEEIRAIREGHKMTLAEMAARLGLKLRSYQKLESPESTSSHRKPGGSVLVLLRQMAAVLEERKRSP